MAIFSLKHEGKNLRQLKHAVRYNSKDKAGFNSAVNPRLIGVQSNCGYCLNVHDENEYNQLVDNFLLTVEANKCRSTNSRQKYLYEHAVISFSIDDDIKLGIKKATALAIETATQYDPAFEDTPYMLWPQVDSGKLHMHLIRSFYDDQGKYHKQSYSKKKMTESAQRIEKKHNLTLTGRNSPENYIFKTLKNGQKKKVYFPQRNQDNNKSAKNKAIDFKIIIDEKGHINYIKQLKKEIQHNENNVKKITKIKSTITNQALNNTRLLKGENNAIKMPVHYSFIQKHITNFSKFDQLERSEKIKENNNKITKINHYVEDKKKVLSLKQKQLIISSNEKVIDQKKLEKCLHTDTNKVNDVINNNDKINAFKKVINDAYRNAKTAQDFIRTLNNNNIDARVSMRKNGNGGVSFHHIDNGFSLAGGKINSYLTYGKIKQNDPELFRFLMGEECLDELNSACNLTVMHNVDVSSLNDNYQQKPASDGSTYIYYHKKDADKYPFNYNLKISANKQTISIGQNSNIHDITLAYQWAKKSGWSGATSDNRHLVLQSMKAAYKEDTDDLFFFSTTKPTLNFDDLKAIINDDLLSKNNLIKLYDNNLIVTEDKNNLKRFIINQLKAHGEDITTLNILLADNQSLKDCLNPDNEQRKQLEASNIQKNLERENQAIKLKPNINTPTKNKSLKRPTPRSRLKLKPNIESDS